MRTSFLITAASAALLLPSIATAQTQTQQPQRDILGQVLGAVFGQNQQTSERALETDWNQGRRPFAQRRAQLDLRIDAAVRDGTLTRRDAAELRSEYEDIVELEAEYSEDGSISPQQRSDLRTRYRALSQRVGDRGTGQDYAQDDDQNDDDDRWQPLADRNADFEQRVTTGLRNRSLTQTQATRLRADWRALGQVETGYQRGGIDTREQADLQTRYDAIDTRLGGSAAVGIGGGYGNDRNTARWTQMETRLASAERGGSISRNDAVQVRAQLSDLARLDAAYGIGGYSADERAYLTQRYGELDDMIGNRRR